MKDFELIARVLATIIAFITDFFTELKPPPPLEDMNDDDFVD